MLHVSEQMVRRHLAMEAAVDLMRRSFAALAAGEARNQPRRRLALPGGTVLHQMAAACGPYLGTKIYTTHVRHGAHFHFLLFDAATGEPLALFEANYLGQIRTGAASGYATDLLAAPDADTAAIIGAGFQAATQLEAILAVRPIRRVRVWSRREENRRRFAQESSERFSVPVEPAATAEAAVRGAAVVTTVTYAKEPVLRAEWIAPGAHINAVGSNNPGRRELPSELLDQASVIVVDSIEQARIESGDLLLAAPLEQWSRLPIVELADVPSRVGERRSADGITIFKSNGLAVEDVAAAGYVYERLTKAGEVGGG